MPGLQWTGMACRSFWFALRSCLRCCFRLRPGVAWLGSGDNRSVSLVWAGPGSHGRSESAQNLDSTWQMHYGVR